MSSENTPSTLDTTPLADVSENKVNWKQVAAYIGLTFGLTWILDLVIFLIGGLSHPAITIALQFQMLLPAFSAILLGMFIFKNSPINVKNNRSISRWFTWYFLLFTLLYAAAVIVAFIRPDLAQSISAAILIPSVIGLLLTIVLRAVGGKNTFARIGMGGGKAILWLLFSLGIILFAGLQTLLNWIFKMGQPVDLSALLGQTASLGMPPSVLMVVVTAQTLILGPFLGLLVAFGEEYGWRGYLQPALYGLGRVRAVTLVGIIWGIWHWPVIWMGNNYPGHPYLGSLLMVLYSVGLAFLLGYAVLKAKGVWIAAFLHALVNQSFGYFMGIIYAPDDPAYSFGIGIPGFIFVAIIIALILRDPIWKKND